MDATLATIVFAGIATTAFVAALFYLVLDHRGPKQDQRLKALLSSHRATAKVELLKKETWSEQLETALSPLGKWANSARKFLAIYEQANLPLALPTFLFITCGLATSAAIATGLVYRDARLVPFGAALVASAPFIWMFFQRSRRIKQFGRQLPEALDLLCRAIRSGQSLPAAMRAVTDDMLPPVSVEFQRACESNALGTPLEDALEALLTRVPSDDLRFFVTAVQIQKQSGGNLTEVLDKIGACVRERIRLEGQLQALTGEGRITGVVLMALPIAMFAAMLVLNRDYVNILLTDPLGERLLQGCVVLQVIGAVVIRQMVKIED